MSPADETRREQSASGPNSQTATVRFPRQQGIDGSSAASSLDQATETSADGGTLTEPLIPEQNRGTEVPAGQLGTKVHAFQESDRDRQALQQWDIDAATDKPLGQPIARRHTPAWRRRYTAALIALDVGAAFLLALATTWAMGATTATITAAVFSIGMLAVYVLGRVYEHKWIGNGFEEFERIATAGVAYVAVTAMVAYAVDWQGRGLVLAAAPAAVVFALGAHLIARQLLYALRRRGHCRATAVVIGLERSIAEMMRTLKREPHGGISVVAACVSKAFDERIEGIPVAGTPAQALEVVEQFHADTVMLTAWSDVGEPDLRRLSWQLEGSRVQLLVAPRLTEVAVPRMHIQNVGGMPLLYVEEPEFTGMRRVAKGLLDIGLASLGVLLLSPVLIGVALAVKLTSRGSVFFFQERIGKNSKPFKMIKFRSMYVDAEKRLQSLPEYQEHGAVPMFKMKDDPRVTPIGKFIRRYSLDELPQLFNVLNRTMSLVGPRPQLATEVASYEDFAHRRLLVKPGITGLWQVSGRSDLSWEEAIRLDLNYVENWSLGFDISLIARTVVAVVAQRGAY